MAAAAAVGTLSCVLTSLRPLLLSSSLDHLHLHHPPTPLLSVSFHPPDNSHHHLFQKASRIPPLYFSASSTDLPDSLLYYCPAPRQPVTAAGPGPLHYEHQSLPSPSIRPAHWHWYEACISGIAILLVATYDPEGQTTTSTHRPLLTCPTKTLPL